MEDVIVRLKTLDSEAGGGGHDDSRGHDVVADSWIGKPGLMEAPDDDGPGGVGGAGDFGSSPFDDENFFSHEWDCDGCPPPYFDLPPPPRPPPLTVAEEEYCSASGSGSGVASPFDTCDHPLIIDSDLRWENDLLNIVLVVICACLLVGLALVVAFVVWRKRLNLLRPFLSRGGGGKSSSSIPPPPGVHAHGSGGGGGTIVVDDLVVGSHHYPNHQKCASNFPTHFLSHPLGGRDPHQLGGNSIELSEQPGGVGGHHVYTNPNYPSLEIGGLPFYLLPGGEKSPEGDIDTCLSANGDRRPRDANVQQLQASSNFRPAPTSNQPFYEPGSSVASSQRSGPIYEDIDRMCTYRGSPPELAQRAPEQRVRHDPEGEDERTYYNVLPAGKAGDRRDGNPTSTSSSRPTSGSSTSPQPAHSGTSSSEVSFDSSGSPCRHVHLVGGVAGVGIVLNPMSPQTLNRLRAMSPSTLSERTRSPQSVYSAKLANNRSPGSKSSVYYYSDTLRPGSGRRNRPGGSAADSDSGISNNRSSEDTPPPQPQLSFAPSRSCAAAPVGSHAPLSQRTPSSRQLFDSEVTSQESPGSGRVATTTAAAARKNKNKKSGSVKV